MRAVRYREFYPHTRAEVNEGREPQLPRRGRAAQSPGVQSSVGHPRAARTRKHAIAETLLSVADVRWSFSRRSIERLALALFELHAATGRDEYREAAFGAVAYEDQFLDPKENNWKDLRAEGEQPVQSDGHTMAWCHGAPGIALARLRAIELLPDRATELRASADIALRGTERHAATQLSAQAFDVTSCHGLAGLAEPFVLASRVLGDSTFLQRARSLWSDALRRREENAVWLSGVGSGGKNHSLMIGMAGAGYGLLRAHDPVQTPSLLLPE